MRIALVLEPLSESNLELAAQIGVDDIVGRYPGADYADLLALRQRVEDAGLRLAVVEGYVPMDRIVLGKPGRDSQIQNVIGLVRNMGALGVPILCYNFMVSGDMSRTSFTTRGRGGALVSAFDASLLEDAPPAPDAPITESQLWERIQYFLEAVVPAAEQAGVQLAMHPDDPPIPSLRGISRIFSSVEAFEHLARLVPSPSNGICFCQGCFAEMGVDVPATIRRLGPKIHYVHFRDVVGCASKFTETFHDCGQTDMASAMRAYRDIGFHGPMRPDHVPRLEGEAGDATGYTILGRLFAVGYMRGLMHAVLTESR
jgi:mannonate dehydratase